MGRLLCRGTLCLGNIISVDEVIFFSLSFFLLLLLEESGTAFNGNDTKPDLFIPFFFPVASLKAVVFCNSLRVLVFGDHARQ